MDLIHRWKRRAWREDITAIAQLQGTSPAIVITGGSDGIGLALARAFASPDHTIVLIARDEARLENALSTLDTSGRNAALALSQDICDPQAAATIRTFLVQNNLFADILINSAGIATTGDFAAAPSDRIAATADLNVTALTRLCREFLPDMTTRGRGGIINISSLGGFAPGPYQATYYASKAYIISLTRALAYETRGQGVRIACVAPGPVNTQFHARANGETSLYRYILPTLSPGQVARSTWRGYQIGHTIIIPGLFNNLLGLALRFLPGALTEPIVAVLLKPRPAKK